MPLTRCSANKHFYNPESFEECPSCNTEAKEKGTELLDRSNGKNKNTKPVSKNDNTIQITPGGTKDTNKIKKDNKLNTRVITGENDKQVINNMGQLPVVGWLIVLNGAGAGTDFKLIQGENKIGRNKDLEICLDFGAETDTTVSRETHAIVVFDNHSAEFFIERGASRNLPKLNNKTVRRDQDLAENDIIELGKTQLLFKPLCNKDFNW